MNADIIVIKSNRKSVAIRVNDDLSVTVRAPKRATNREINEIVLKHEAWIQKQIDARKERNRKLESGEIKQLSKEELNELMRKAKAYIPLRVEYYASLMGLDYGRITIRNQKTRWGSCSSKKNLNFNCKLMLTPPEVIDYVVVHELCHIKQMNHSKAFWNEVEKIIPNYKELRRWLKENSSGLID